MFHLTVTVPAVFSDRPLGDGIAAAGELGVDGIEFFDWETHGIAAVAERCTDAGVELAATLSAGGGANIDKADAPAMTDPDCRERVIADISRSIDACETVGCPTLIATVGPDQDALDESVQRDAIVDVLTSVVTSAEDADVTIAVEPLNTCVDHPGYFLSSSDEAFNIVDEVGSSHVKVLFDVYHQQITEGDVTRQLSENVEHVGHVHIADNPGRGAPGTGELNYENVLAALHEAGYEGAVGCEFIPETDPAKGVQTVRSFVEHLSQ